MKKVIPGFIAILVLVGLVFGSYKLLFSFINNLYRPIIKSDEDVKNAKTAVLCNWKKNSCNFYKPPINSGNLKITITVDGKPGKKIEVNLWNLPQPGGSDEAFVKYTNSDGIALFDNIPSGIYYPNYNLNGFPKEYGNAYMTWGTHEAKVAKGTTKEILINLNRK